MSKLQSAQVVVSAQGALVEVSSPKISIRLHRPPQCPKRKCRKRLFTMAVASGFLPAGLMVLRECPRQKDILCGAEIVAVSSGIKQ